MSSDTHPDHWLLSILYFNREDSRIIVRKRTRLGWTFNFGNPFVWATGAALFAVAIFIAIANN